MISSAATRPPPIFGSRRWDTIQRSVSARPDADLLLFLLVEHAEDTVDRLAGIDRVQCAHDQMAGFRGGHADLDGFAVAHFADENDLGSLAQRGAQSGGEGAEVVAHFALVESRLLLRMHEFDGIFERDDVDRLGLVQFVQQGRQRCRLTGAGRAGDQHQPGFFLCNRVENRRQIELIDAWNVGRQFPQNDRVIAALGEDIDAEARLLAKRVGAVARTRLDQILGQPAVAIDEIAARSFRSETA